MLIPPFQQRLLKVRDQVRCFVSPPSHPPPYLHNVDHMKGIQWILVYSNSIIVGNLLSDLWMNKFSIFNFLFVFVTQWRSIVLNCIQNFCLQSTVSVMSCRPKKKKQLLASGKQFLQHYYWQLMLTWNYFFTLAELWTQIHVHRVSFGVSFSLMQTS